MGNIFTGQEITGEDHHDSHRPYAVVICPVCKQPVSLRVAYIDPYFNSKHGGEVYVHYECLSAQRKHEIEVGR